MTLHPKAPASLTAQAMHPLPRRLIRAFQPLSAHKARATISRSLPEATFWFGPDVVPITGDETRDGGYFVIGVSVQSITSTFRIPLEVVWVLDKLGSRFWFGLRKVEKDVVAGLRRMSRMETRV
jgi:hypothetical protein